MTDQSSKTPIRDADITNCIRQLAERAVELNELDTAAVLFTLAGHRAIGIDAALAFVARVQAQLMRDEIEKIQNKNEDV